MKHRMMNPALMLAALLATAGATVAQSQKADLRVLSAVIGYGSARITGLDTIPDQVMQGLNVRMDLHILSLVLHGLPLRTYDALFADVSYGLRTSDSLHGLFPGDVQPKTGFQATFGYQFLAGPRLSGIALLGGLGFEQHYHDIGGSTVNGKSTPLVARLEIGGHKPIVVTGWHAVGGDVLNGARIDVPFFRRLNLTAMYWQADGQADVWSNPSNAKVPAKARLLVIGVRTAEL
jgi:hypothetical protein